jgi:ATP-dependent Clp protease adapter protein ClpS
MSGPFSIAQADFIAVTTLLGLLVFVGLWWARGRKVSAPDTEVQIVLALASRIATEKGWAFVDDALFVAASLSNTAVARGFERAGVNLDGLRRSIEGSSTPTADPVSTNAALQAAPDLTISLATARRAASKRGDSVFTLADVLEAVRTQGDGEASALLRTHPLGFDDAVLASVVPIHPNPEASGHFVYIWNDPVSPMERVVRLLGSVFDQFGHAAVYTMLTVHYRGYVAMGPFEPAVVDELLARAAKTSEALETAQLKITRTPPDTLRWRMTERGLLPG